MGGFTLFIEHDCDIYRLANMAAYEFHRYIDHDNDPDDRHDNTYHDYLEAYTRKLHQILLSSGQNVYLSQIMDYAYNVESETYTAIKDLCNADFCRFALDQEEENDEETD